ncbi:reverse transcriptase-like protein [Leuconostoc falkenbergense]|uniref:ribonuclease HI family protein n=1 Tax=Leuconostoc falkenbergense TaxID=2766470 RepID=UPI0016667CF3|nr:ribonuclease HI family protein [Leuconostoc falkenbergense]MCT4404342.1 reverse transcriptase-like protein [Leuconostoc falkenbergense]MDI6666903.1 ribonuclease HI family protein [Leuconostoc falkenbergense]
MMTLYVDAARNVHDGQSAVGAVLIINKQQQQLKNALPQSADNHEAEFMGLIWSIKQLPMVDNLQIYTDSKIVADAIQKKYAKHYQSYVDQIMTLLTEYPLVLVNWIPEKQNHGAHQLAMQALKKAKR